MERDENPFTLPEQNESAPIEAPVRNEGSQEIVAALSKELADERERRMEAEERANKDDLLESMYRKRATIELIEGRIERGEVFAVYFLDINNFKRYNDMCGHIAGDALLRTIEILLNERFQRKTDNVKIGRYGGDEILLVVTDIVTGGKRSDDIYEQAENIENLLRSVVPALHEVDAHARECKVGFAIGSQLFDPENPMGAKELIDLADQEMYKDKQRQKWEAKSKLARFVLSALGKKPTY